MNDFPYDSRNLTISKLSKVTRSFPQIPKQQKKERSGRVKETEPETQHTPEATVTSTNLTEATREPIPERAHQGKRVKKRNSTTEKEAESAQESQKRETAQQREHKTASTRERHKQGDGE